jgi:hypothetical protein
MAVSLFIAGPRVKFAVPGPSGTWRTAGVSGPVGRPGGPPPAVRQPNIHHHNARLRLPGQYVDSSAASGKVPHHLRRHLGGVGADSFLCDAVIGSHYHHGLTRKRRRDRAVNRCDLASEILQHAEASARLGLAVQALTHSASRFAINRNDRATGFRKQCHLPISAASKKGRRRFDAQDGA